jgi:hypothetical protein
VYIFHGSYSNCKTCRLFCSHSQLNANGDNTSLLAAILCAALYPNVVKVLTPEKSFAPSASGAVPIEFRAHELRFMTRDDGYVSTDIFASFNEIYTDIYSCT